MSIITDLINSVLSRLSPRPLEPYNPPRRQPMDRSAAFMTAFRSDLRMVLDESKYKRHEVSSARASLRALLIELDTMAATQAENPHSPDNDV